MEATRPVRVRAPATSANLGPAFDRGQDRPRLVGRARGPADPGRRHAAQRRAGRAAPHRARQPDQGGHAPPLRGRQGTPAAAAPLGRQGFPLGRGFGSSAAAVVLSLVPARRLVAPTSPRPSCWPWPASWRATPTTPPPACTAGPPWPGSRTAGPARRALPVHLTRRHGPGRPRADGDQRGPPAAARAGAVRGRGPHRRPLGHAAPGPSRRPRAASLPATEDLLHQPEQLAHTGRRPSCWAGCGRPATPPSSPGPGPRCWSLPPPGGAGVVADAAEALAADGAEGWRVRPLELATRGAPPRVDCGSSRVAVRRRMRQPLSVPPANDAGHPVPDKLTSPAGEEFMADASVNRVLVKGVVAVMHARTERLWSTKEGDMFLCCADAEGNLDAEQATGAGFYWRDTRYLSDFRLEVGERAPAAVDLGRPSLRQPRRPGQPGPARGGRLGRGRPGHGQHPPHPGGRRPPVRANPDQELQRGGGHPDRPADLRHRLRRLIFEVRGLKRAVRGKLARPKADGRSAVFAYEGEDGVFRETRIAFGVGPTRLGVHDEHVVAEWELRLEPTQTELIALTAEPRASATPAAAERSFDVVMHDLRRSYETWERACAGLDRQRAVQLAAVAGPAGPPGAAHPDPAREPGGRDPGSWRRSAATRCSPATRP